MIETPADRAEMFADWGSATVGGTSIPGMYDAPDGESVGVSSYSPTFHADRATLLAAGVAVGIVIDSITNHAGTTVGPFRVAVWMPQDDGETVILQLDAGS